MTDLLSRRAASRIEARKGGNVGTSPAPAPKAASPAQKFAAIQDDARRKTAAAWTTAKNLLPGVPAPVQQRLAMALIAAPTAVLTETLRSVARMAFYTKAAEKFEKDTRQDLNVLVEDESMMTKLRDEVFAELKKDDPKTASKGKKADEPEVAEDQPKPKEEPKAPAQPAEPGAPADMPAPGGEGGDAAKGEFAEPPAGPEAAPGEMGDPGAGVDPASPANQVADSATDESLMDRIEQVEHEIEQIADEVSDASDEALDLDAIFDPEVQSDKAQNLANQGDEMEHTEHDDFFAPGEAGETEPGEFGGHHETTDADFFKDASGPDPLSALLNLGSPRTASEGVDVEMGDMADHFKTDLPSDDRDSESDHDDTLLGDVLDSITPEVMKQKRDTQDKLETPPAANEGMGKEAGVQSKPQSQVKAEAAKAKKSSIRTVGQPVPVTKEAGTALSDAAIAAAVLGDDF